MNTTATNFSRQKREKYAKDFKTQNWATRTSRPKWKLHLHPITKTEMISKRQRIHELLLLDPLSSSGPTQRRDRLQGHLSKLDSPKTLCDLIPTRIENHGGRSSTSLVEVTTSGNHPFWVQMFHPTKIRARVEASSLDSQQKTSRQVPGGWQNGNAGDNPDDHTHKKLTPSLFSAVPEHTPKTRLLPLPWWVLPRPCVYAGCKNGQPAEEAATPVLKGLAGRKNRTATNTTTPLPYVWAPGPVLRSRPSGNTSYIYWSSLRRQGRSRPIK